MNESCWFLYQVVDIYQVLWWALNVSGLPWAFCAHSLLDAKQDNVVSSSVICLSLASFSSFVILEKLSIVMQKREVVVYLYLIPELYWNSFLQPLEFYYCKNSRTHFCPLKRWWEGVHIKYLLNKMFWRWTDFGR